MKRQIIQIAVMAIMLLALGSMLSPSGYPVRILCLILLAACIGQSWNIVGGLANQISLGHAAFFGIGAYTSTVLQISLGVTPWLGLPAAMLLAAVVALLISMPTMRLKGPYFALATLAFGEACRIIAVSMPSITGGPQGISIPFIGNSWPMMQFRGAGGYLPILVVLLTSICLVFTFLSHGRMGYYLRAIRENEDAAEVAGVNTLKVKLIGGAVSAACMAATGVMFAQFTFFFDPDSVFSVAGISIRAALIAIVGGVGTLAGPLLGAVVVVLIEEVLSAYLSNKSAGVAPFTFGVILILIVLLRPRGLVSIFTKQRPGGKQ